MRDHVRTELPLAAMMMAAQRQRPTEGLICHPDRGQYASEAYGNQLAAMNRRRIHSARGYRNPEQAERQMA